MSLNAISNFFSSMSPSAEKSEGKFSLSIPQVARNLNKIAIPALIFYASCHAPGAEAGALGFFAGYIGTTLLGGAMIAVGTVTAPVGGAALMVAGTTTIAAAPYVGAVTGGFTGPV